MPAAPNRRPPARDRFPPRRRRRSGRGPPRPRSPGTRRRGRSGRVCVGYVGRARRRRPAGRWARSWSTSSSGCSNRSASCCPTTRLDGTATAAIRCFTVHNTGGRGDRLGHVSVRRGSQAPHRRTRARRGRHRDRPRVPPARRGAQGRRIRASSTATARAGDELRLPRVPTCGRSSAAFDTPTDAATRRSVMRQHRWGSPNGWFASPSTSPLHILTRSRSGSRATRKRPSVPERSPCNGSV